MLQVCDCKGQASNDPGYLIDAQCNKVNVNECATGTAVCHRNAICLDKDSTVNATDRYECICPPGLFGDGVASCNVNAYQTKFSLVQRGVSFESFDVPSFKTLLYSNGVIPAIVPPEKVSVTVSAYIPPTNLDGGGARRVLSSPLADHEVLSSHARLHDYKMDLLRSASTSSSTATQRRHLLQQASQDAQVDVTIFSETVGEMNQILQSTNVTLLGSFEILADPYTYTDNINNADEPTSVVSPGFEVRGCFLTDVSVV